MSSKKINLLNKKIKSSNIDMGATRISFVCVCGGGGR
jgi:hypothetical protein